jgi:hypothetical protein
LQKKNPTATTKRSTGRQPPCQRENVILTYISNEDRTRQESHLLTSPHRLLFFVPPPRRISTKSHGRKVKLRSKHSLEKLTRIQIRTLAWKMREGGGEGEEGESREKKTPSI